MKDYAYICMFMYRIHVTSHTAGPGVTFPPGVLMLCVCVCVCVCVSVCVCISMGH